MFLFEDKDEIELSIKCKLCLEEIKFTLTKEEYEDTEEFPIKKESIHGEKPHKLMVFINKNAEIETFEIETIEEEKASYSEELTRQVLSEIGLSDEEIELYFLTTGREAVSLGELAILIDKEKEECIKIANKFVEKGLFKEIVGVKPHYRALPPYAALVSQLNKFHHYISEIKKIAPRELNKSFDSLEAEAKGVKQLNEYTDFMQGLKDNALKDMYSQKKQFDEMVSQIGQIREVTGAIAHLEQDTTELMVNQLNDLKERFQDILKKIFGIMKEQISELKKEFQSIQDKTSENLKKLRLGVIQQTVEQVIDKVFKARIKFITQLMNNQLQTIKGVFTEGLKQTVSSFNSEVLAKLKTTIEDIVTNVDNVTTTTAKSGDEIRQIFADVSKNFSKAVIMAEEKLGGISDNILESFDSLKETFSVRVIESLEDELGNILDKLEVSEITTREFWDKAKETSRFTMKDIWFIRSVEGAKAHIDDEIKKAKMRVLIVIPDISEINIETLKSIPRHINIRIAAFIDLGSPEHQKVIEKLDQMPNVSYRHRDLQNLWGINRDYEEVILCVLSQTEIGGKFMTEIAGIGSIIEEHIKIFVPILEDAWIGAQKDLSYVSHPSRLKSLTSKPSISAKQQVALKNEKTAEPKPEPVSKPQPQPTKPSEPLPKPSLQEQPKTQAKPQEKPKSEPQKEEAAAPSVMDVLQNRPLITSEDQTSQPEPISHPVSPAQPGPTSQPSPSPKPAPKSSSGPVSDSDLGGQLDTLISNIGSMNAGDVARALQQFNDAYSEQKGYSAVLKQITLTANQLINNPGSLNRGQLTNKINFWRKKLHV